MSDFKNQSPWGTPPGGGGNGDGFRRGPTPPNIDEVVRKLQDKIKTQGQLFVLTGSKNPSLRFDFYDLWPKSISTINFDITAAEVTYATADVAFQYNYYEMTRLSASM